VAIIEGNAVEVIGNINREGETSRHIDQQGDTFVYIDLQEEASANIYQQGGTKEFHTIATAGGFRHAYQPR